LREIYSIPCNSLGFVDAALDPYTKRNFIVGGLSGYLFNYRIVNNYNLEIESSIKTSDRISSVRWSNNKDKPNMITISNLGNTIYPGVLNLYNNSLQEIYSLTMPYRNLLWSHEWGPHNDIIALGGSKGALMVCVENSKFSQLLYTKVADIFCQAFNPSGNILANGSRDGCINLIDIKEKKK